MASHPLSGDINHPLVAVVGTCDTKLAALVLIKHLVSKSPCDAILIDIGTNEPSESTNIDISHNDVLGQPASSLVGLPRNEVQEAMTRGLAHTLKELCSSDSPWGCLAGVIAAGGSCNTSICTQAFRKSLPIGLPKLMVSTMASGDVSHYIGETDITMMHSVVDVAGLNQILESVLRNAAHAITGMASHYSRSISSTSRPAVAVTMFGVTTPCVDAATKLLDQLGYDAVVFHATGTGGQAMERLISEGKFVGVLDITTTELADELVGGVLSAGPNRLEAAAKAGVPQVVSVGALDMVNFGPKSTVPKHFGTERLFHEHNTSVTLMRTTKDECAALGRILAKKVNLAPELTHILIPRGGVSMIDVEGMPFYDPAADQMLFDTLRTHAHCPVSEFDLAINDHQFAKAAVDTLHSLVSAQKDL